MQKRELRKQFKELRDTISPVDRKREDLAILENLRPWIEDTSLESWMVYLSFGSETDTTELIRKLLTLGKEVFAPRMTEKEELESVRLRDSSEYETHTWGIREPKGVSMPHDFRADVVIVPGLAFDAKGNRLGYGRGFYDRFLTLRPRLCIGIAYQCQLAETLPTEKHDLPLDTVVSSDGIVSLK